MDAEEIEAIRAEFKIEEPRATTKVVMMALLVMRRIVAGDALIELPDGSTIAVVRVKKEMGHD